MLLSTTLSWATFVLLGGLVAALLNVSFLAELASTCCLVAAPVSVSVVLYLAFNRLGCSTRVKYVGFFFPVLCITTYAVVIYLIARVEGTWNNHEGAQDILECLLLIYVVEVCVAFVCLRYFSVWKSRPAEIGETNRVGEG